MTGAIRWKDAEGVVQEEDAGCRRGDGQMLMGRERAEGEMREEGRGLAAKNVLSAAASKW